MKELSAAYTVVMVLLVFALIWIVSWASFSFGQTDGYCSALGGSPIGMSNVCDVSGKVVVVE